MPSSLKKAREKTRSISADRYLQLLSEDDWTRQKTEKHVRNIPFSEIQLYEEKSYWGQTGRGPSSWKRERWEIFKYAWLSENVSLFLNAMFEWGNEHFQKRNYTSALYLWHFVTSLGEKSKNEKWDLFHHMLVHPPQSCSPIVNLSLPRSRSLQPLVWVLTAHVQLLHIDSKPQYCPYNVFAS